eukprot:COSAG01_NODE_17233_length_1167_cov_18.388577_2_plen_68_part_00
MLEPPGPGDNAADVEAAEEAEAELKRKEEEEAELKRKEEEEDIVAEVARLRAEAAERQKQMEDMQQL